MAPEDLDGNCHYLFAGHDDPLRMEAGATSFAAWLDDHRDDAEPGYSLTSLLPAEVSGIAHPDRDPALALGAAAWAASPHSLAEHLELIVRADQSVVDPDHYPQFDRELLEGGDCFRDGGCDVLRTWNTAIKTSYFDIAIAYEFHKDYVRVPFSAPDGEQRQAVVARIWVPEEGYSDDGDYGILQSYGVDVFIEDGQGGVVRLQTQWLETLTTLGDLLTDDVLVSQSIDGLQDVFSTTDAWLDGSGE